MHYTWLSGVSAQRTTGKCEGCGKRLSPAALQDFQLRSGFSTAARLVILAVRALETAEIVAPRTPISACSPQCAALALTRCYRQAVAMLEAPFYYGKGFAMSEGLLAETVA